jgi:NAD(P)-dependent dehydrogenase (short-subunit alcohol dehydrogenase family)
VPEHRGETVIVTGGGRGVGRAIAIELAGRGYSVAVLARSQAEIDDTRGEIAAGGGRALALCCDVRDGDAVATAVASAAELDPVTGLVNNAGTGLALGPLWTVDPTEWWTDIETSVRGAFNSCRAVIPGFIERGAGRIVNVASYVGVRPSPYQTGYAAGKAALVNLTESLAVSLAPHGVQVFAFTPGFVDTALTRRILETPTGRTWLPEVGTGTIVPAERGARMVAALVSGEADRLTGRFVHALDELDDLVARIGEIERDDLYAPRVRRLATPSAAATRRRAR